MTALIIDDMPEAIALLRHDLANHCPSITVIGEAEGVVSGAQHCKKLMPDLLLLDIHLRDGTGFDLLELLPDHYTPQVIFTTVSDAHALRAFRYAAVDYLLKPIQPSELISAVHRAARFAKRNQAGQREVLLAAARQRHPPQRLALHTQDRIQVVPISEVVRCEADSNYTHFHLADGSKLLVAKTLKEYETILEEHAFLRIHQSHLINLQYVKAYLKADGGQLLLNNGRLLPVAARRRAAVLAALAGNDPDLG